MKRKNLIPIIIVVLAVLLGCEKDEVRTVVHVNTPPQWATAGGGSYVFLEEDVNDPFQTFTWTKADFGFQAPTSYTVEFDFAGASFSDPQIVGVTTNLQFPVTVGEMNNKLLAAEAVSGVASDIEFRTYAAVHTDVDTLYSNLISMNITPYDVVVAYTAMYVPGSYQGVWDASLGWGGWDPANEFTKVYSVANDGAYEGYLYFNEAETGLKFSQVPAWEGPYEVADPEADGKSGTLQIGGGNDIKVTNTGFPIYYLVKADLNALTYSFTATDWGLIGDATAGGWDSDEDMTYDPVSDTWSITTDLTAAKIKFRANDDWAINYGDPLGNGKLVQDGADIIIDAAGNYTITMNLSEAIYTYTIVQN